MADLADYTLDQYISDLLALRKANPGSSTWPVEKFMPSKGRHRAPLPTVAYRQQKMVKTSNGVKPVLGNFWSSFDPPEEKGEPVIRL